MPLQHLQHFLDPDRGSRKDQGLVRGCARHAGRAASGFQVSGVLALSGGDDVLHITQGGAKVSENRMKYLGQQSTATTGSGVVDHVAFSRHRPPRFDRSSQAEEHRFKERRVNDHAPRSS